MYRAIKRKRDNLDDVIHYEDVAQRNDSILRLVNLSEADRLAYFTEYTDKLKEKALALQEEAERLKQTTGPVINKQNKPGKRTRQYLDLLFL